MRLIDYDKAIERYRAEYDKQDICDGMEDTAWLRRCFEEAPTVDTTELIEDLMSDLRSACECNDVLTWVMCRSMLKQKWGFEDE